MRLPHLLPLAALVAGLASPAFATNAIAVASEAKLPSQATISELVEHLLREETFNDVAMSPGGTFFAATVRKDGRTGLVIGNVADLTILSVLAGQEDSHVSDFWWVNDTQIVASMGESFGQLEAPRDFGELWLLHAKKDVSPRMLAGWRGAEMTTGTRLARNADHTKFVFMSDPLRNDDDHILVSVEDIQSGGEGFSTAELLDLDSGRRKIVARAPVRRASFLADSSGEVRFAYGAGSDNRLRTYYRAASGEAWQILNDETVSHVRVFPIGFSADDSVAYVQSSHRDGPDSIDRVDLETLERTIVLRDDVVDPHSVLYDPATGEPFGAVFMDGVPTSRFFDPESPSARTQRSLEAAFEGQQVNLRSTTRDGNQRLVIVSSDVNPGDFYHFDKKTGKAVHWASRSAWIDPDQMASRTPIRLEARDGLPLHGYLTRPAGNEGRLPTIVLVHGGPFGVRDTYDYDSEVQLLAARGYAVLQVNFRGSGGYGDAFFDAGARQWGLALQDDVTDATRWAIEAGHSDPTRICIYGASYGGYAAMMGAAKEPDLYRCAAGNVGVYDLEMMYSRGDIQERRSGENFLAEWLGSDELAKRSPTTLAGQIRVPVFLAAGAEDQRAPQEHTKAMAAALEAAGNTPTLKIYEREGHGYYKIENRRDYYRRLLTFFDTHLGTNAVGAGSK